MSNYLIYLLGALNELKPVDIVFFIVCAALIAAIVGVYFLIPVLNKKQYEEQRENLRKREEAFKVNKKTASDESTQQEADSVNDDSQEATNE